MTDHSLGQAVPIVGISINPDNGEVSNVVPAQVGRGAAS